jgi:hypothetical protein
MPIRKVIAMMQSPDIKRFRRSPSTSEAIILSPYAIDNGAQCSSGALFWTYRNYRRTAGDIKEIDKRHV